MKVKILIILIILVGLSIGGYFIWKNISAPKEEVEIPLATEEELEKEEIEEIILPEHCKDGLYNKGEEGLDCGWSCPNKCKFTEKDGRLRKDETWSGNILVNRVEIPKGITLTIKPGTIVKFKHWLPIENGKPMCRRGGGSQTIIVAGSLRAIGTPDKMIWFTSDSELPTNGDWRGLEFINSQESILKYTITEYALQGISIWDNSRITISQSIVRWVNWEGIYLEKNDDPAVRPTIEYSRIYQNAYWGIAMEQKNYPYIHHNHFWSDEFDISSTGGILVDYSSPTIKHNLFTKGDVINTGPNSSAVIQFNDIDGGIGISNSKSAEISYNTVKRGFHLTNLQKESIKINNNNIFVDWFHVENVGVDIDATNNYWGETDFGKFYDPNNQIRSLPVRESEIIGDGKENITHEIVFDYPDLRNFDLGYRPGDEKDRYPYIYLDEDETRKILRKEVPGYPLLWTITHDSNYFYTSVQDQIFKLDPNTFEIIEKFITPSDWLRGVESDGTYLWVNGYSTKRLHKIDPSTHQEIASIPLDHIPNSPKGQPGFADGELYFMVSQTSKFYRLDKNTGEILEEHDLDFGGGWGLTYDGNNFYTCCGDRVCKFDRNGRLKGQIYGGSQGCWDVDWADGKIWTAERTNENWIDPKLYQLEIKNDQLLWRC